MAIRAGLFEDSEMKNAIEIFAATGKESMYKKIVQQCQLTGFYKPRLRSNAFEVPLSQEQISGEVNIGQIVDSDFSYGFDFDDITCHIYGSGAPGKGKTVLFNGVGLQLIRKGYLTVFIDPKGGDFNGLIPEGVLYLKWHDLKFNFFDGPDNLEQKLWNTRLAEALSEPLGLLVASLGTLQGLLEDTYNKWKDNVNPCFRELHRDIKSLARSYGKTDQYRQTVEQRIDTIMNTLAPVVDCRRGFMPELMSQSFILDVSGMIGIAQNILVEIVMAYIYEWHRVNVPREREHKLVRAVFIDEAQHNVLAISKSRTAKQGAAGMEQYIALGRELGLGFIASSQSPSKILPEMINDAHLRITFGLGSGEEVWKMARALGLTQEQTEMVMHLQVGEAIVRKASGYTNPVLIKCFQANLKMPTDEDWKRNDEQIKMLEEKAELWSPEDTKGKVFVGTELTDNAERLLKSIGSDPLCITMDYYKRAGIPESSGSGSKDMLVREGYIEEVKIQGAGRGEKKTLRLLAKGVLAYQNKMGGKEPAKILRTKMAGYEHDWWCAKVTTYFRKRKVDVKVGWQIGKQEADIVITAGGQTTVYEVTLSEGNVQNKIDMLAKVKTLVFLCINKTQIKGLEKKVEVPKEMQNRVRFELLSQYL